MTRFLKTLEIVKKDRTMCMCVCISLCGSLEHKSNEYCESFGKKTDDTITSRKLQRRGVAGVRILFPDHILWTVLRNMGLLTNKPFPPQWILAMLLVWATLECACSLFSNISKQRKLWFPGELESTSSKTLLNNNTLPNFLRHICSVTNKRSAKPNAAD